MRSLYRCLCLCVASNKTQLKELSHKLVEIKFAICQLVSAAADKIAADRIGSVDPAADPLLCDLDMRLTALQTMTLTAPVCSRRCTQYLRRARGH